MKKNIYSFFVILTIIIFIVTTFTKSRELYTIVNYSINLFITNIFPSLFPMFIISSLLIEIDIPIILGNIFQKITTKLFKTKKEASFIFFMSLITGFPSSAKYIDDLIEKKLLTEKDSQKILMFTFFSNPLFIVNTVGNIFLNNEIIGYLILISHILGNILTGIIFRNYNQSKNNNTQKINNLKHLNNKINNTNLFKTLTKSIKNSLDILINIFGVITFSLIIINLIFKNQNNIINIFLIGITEMTTGLKLLSVSNTNEIIKMVISMFFLSFGGFSIHMQIFNILTKRKVKYLPFLISRIIHGLSSSIILFILLKTII